MPCFTDCTLLGRRLNRVQSAIIPCLIAVFWLFFLMACGDKKTISGPFQIYFTADVSGRLEPCGCFTGQYGGLTRIDTWLNYKDPLASALRLDVGDAIKGINDFDVIHYEHILKGFNHLKYQALNVGSREAALPAATLSEILTRSGAPLVSANLVDETSGDLIFPAYRMVDSQGQKVAVIGLLDPDSVTNTLGQGLMVNSMETTLANWLPKIEQDNAPEITILLAFTNEAKMRSLARQFYELDVILGGDVEQASQELIVENESVILYTTNQARAIGDLKFTLGEDRVTDPKFDIHLMVDSIPQSEVMLALSKSYRELIRTTKLAVDNPATDDEDSLIPGGASVHSFVGSESCAACHPAAMAVWKNSAHSRAFDPLKKGGTDADPNCIGCHTIGFGSESGYRREFGDVKLTHVGCESCHGPGSEHVKQRALGDPSLVSFHFRPLGTADCTKCHHGEFSRPFVWDEFWPMIKHGKEVKTQ